MKTRTQLYFRQLQDEICSGLESIETTGKFREDPWTHGTEGGGRTRILEQGAVFEKAGVNFSAIRAAISTGLAERLKVKPQDVFASGISLVIHPASPMVPTIHMNLRYLELQGGDAWFGGGLDLTPWYLIEEDARFFHRTLKQVCDRYNANWYSQFKEACDEYFFIRHRNETRGIGGIFFDYQRENPDTTFQFVQDLGSSFLKAYTPIVLRRLEDGWGTSEREWQLVRRGRYAEFNLVYDRGTVFGLETQGRVESILMSLPPVVEWKYNVVPHVGSREHALINVLQNPRSWL